MKNTYLYNVWRHSRRLFIVVALFMTGAVVCNLTGNEVTPFFVWGMYSAKEPPVTRYELLQTTINDSLVLNTRNVYTNDTRFYLYAPLGYYKRIKDNQGIDPTLSFLQQKLHDHYHRIRFAEHTLFNTGTQQRAFMHWYARYIGQATGIAVHAIQVDVVQVHYQGDSLVKDSVYLFEKWSTP